MSGPIVLYVGPSALDGAPIVALASLESSNRKTGRLIQTWIMRADMLPTEASHASADASICGACPRRRSLGGDCYVLIHNAPQSAYKAWVRAGRPSANWGDESAIVRLTAEGRDHGLRLGSYGDPAAVPHAVWSDLIGAIQPRAVVGYTHQWRVLHADRERVPVDDGRFPERHARAAWFRSHVMASCDSMADASDARALGWRFFLALDASAYASPPEGTFQCTADRVPGATCASCGACDGARAGRPGVPSVWIQEHGAMSEARHKRARRVAGLQVLTA